MYDLNFPLVAEQRGAPEGSSDAVSDDTSPRHHMLERMLDVGPHSMLLVRHDGLVMFANRLARSELNAEHPIHLHGRRLQVRYTQDVAPLREAITRAACKGLQRLMSIGDPAGRSVTVAIAPAGDPGTGDLSGAMLVFGKREVCEDLSADAFSRQFGLTGAEVRVLKQLCCGRSPAEIAVCQGVAISTVRTQIASIRVKTGVCDIGTLVRQVSLLPPLVSLMRAAA